MLQVRKRNPRSPEEWGAWEDAGSSYAVYPEEWRVVEVREKPSFAPGYFQHQHPYDAGSGVVEWFNKDPNPRCPKGTWKRVQVIPDE